MTIKENIKKTKRRKKSSKSLKLPKIIFIMVILWFFGNAIYSFVISSLIQTELAAEGVIEKNYETHGFIIREEHIITTPSSGTIENLFPDGEKIAKNNEVYAIKTVKGNALQKGQQVSVKAPISGIVSYNIDGLESNFSEDELQNINIKKLAQLQPKNTNNTKKQVVEKGTEVCKIIDNLKDIKCFIEFPLNTFNKPIQQGQVLQIRLPKYDEVVFAPVIDLKGVGNKAQILVEIPRMCYSLINERVIDIEIITKKKEGILLPSKAIVYNENKESGVYWKNRGLVLWRPIKVIEKKDNIVLVQGIDPLTEVITNPKWVKKGQYLY
ncbi:putative membrane fusion protein [Desulfonispora thiosulfatigenes DSM 11270]|uniref:Putative membrane fusion protein n=1 Tax=Desulfonispora thiosulfatigenes DSM 11270 TaxID=656914 RepID=A0A1W1VLI0_DESTI|nr:HlyD family efflux transporter periplasmic adaptor subunit [Desulfonispora thiosulfatigenes]SMB94217.1 putative membrane fusion protein [Desulfonispora thiosulfatigenes DSM 11270]